MFSAGFSAVNFQLGNWGASSISSSTKIIFFITPSEVRINSAVESSNIPVMYQNPSFNSLSLGASFLKNFFSTLLPFLTTS